MTASLTEDDWRRVFALRCKSKRGEALSPAETKLVTRAWRADAARYAAMNPSIFNETAPFGAVLRKSKNL